MRVGISQKPSRTKAPRVDRRPPRWTRLGASLFFLIALLGALPAWSVDSDVPLQADFIDHGNIISPANGGDCSTSIWDCRLGGALSPSSMIKFNGRYFLYYIGSKGGRSDGGPAFRSLGVATCNPLNDCTQAANWTKYAGNPIITYSPHNDNEEGVFSAVALVEGGTVHLWYGADEGQGGTVDCHLYYASSTDGFNFGGRTKVLDGPSCGFSVCQSSGGEIWPLAAFKEGSRYYVYMGNDYWNLHVVSGTSPSQMTSGSQVLNINPRIFSVSIADTGDNSMLFYWLDEETTTSCTSGREDTLQWTVRKARILASSPTQKQPDEADTYRFTHEFTLGHVALIDDVWWLWHLDSCPAAAAGNADPREGEFIRLKTHSLVGSSDDTPPTTPTGLAGTGVSETRIDLTWNGSTDPESGVAGYRVYRGGQPVGTSPAASFSDQGLTENTQYQYRISAINGAGLESTQSAPATVSTAADTTPPDILSVGAGSPTEVWVTFSENVETTSATAVGNYAIDNGITVLNAVLGTTPDRVTLTTTPHSEGLLYSVTVSNVRDLASPPNAMPATTMSYTLFPDLVVSNLAVLSGQPYTVEQGLNTGSLTYVDRGYTYAGIPAALVGATYIRTANDDKLSSQDGFLGFEINRSATIYVAHDDRITPKPAWLASWTDTGEDVLIEGVTHSLLSASRPAGPVSLGGNQAPGSTGGFDMYTVIISGGGGGGSIPAVPSNLRVE